LSLKNGPGIKALDLHSGLIFSVLALRKISRKQFEKMKRQMLIGESESHILVLVLHQEMRLCTRRCNLIQHSILKSYKFLGGQ